jgi:5-methylcytosine-specific restriction endonuclease McrA
VPKMVWAEIESDGKACRIFKNRKAAYLFHVSLTCVQFMLRATAVEEIRRKIWLRDKKRCTHCGNVVSWLIMQMHERLWRGRGGEISVENGTTLCADCHSDDPVAGHGKRKPQW